KDLELSPEQAAGVKAVLTSPSPDPQEAEEMRRLLAGKYAKKAANTYRGKPKITKDVSRAIIVAEYPDGTRFVGDPARGERLYQLSCARCHGTENMPLKAKHLGGNSKTYYKMLGKGTRHRDRPYMPNYTLERLSRQQAADILMYLKQFE
ncbi:MAG: cytochrome c, partial [Candidatus Aerophobus sp.]